MTGGGSGVANAAVDARRTASPSDIRITAIRCWLELLEAVNLGSSETAHKQQQSRSAAEPFSRLETVAVHKSLP